MQGKLIFTTDVVSYPPCTVLQKVQTDKTVNVMLVSMKWYSPEFCKNSTVDEFSIDTLQKYYNVHWCMN